MEFSKIIGEEPRIGRLILKELDAMLSENSRIRHRTEYSFFYENVELPT